jgi:Mg2+ and Co2+ transporter CorA
MLTLPPAVVQTLLLIGVLYLANAYIVKPMLNVAGSMKVEIETLKSLKDNTEQTYLQEIHELQRELLRIQETLKQHEEILALVQANIELPKKKSECKLSTSF